MTAPHEKPARLTVGWREWIALPELGIAAIKPKIDTGARSSSLHGRNSEWFKRDGADWVGFDVHPFQRDAETTVRAEAAVLELRHVRSSSGHSTLRPVILTTIEIGGQRLSVELTLAARDEMGFRMLLGREAVRGRFTVDPGRSYLVSKRPSSKPSSKSPTKKHTRRKRE